ncbi:MAG: deoxyribonuclease IV [Candidatus Bathyarchaeota archaeon]|nr:deoxyribonuclease IV [Candidatus Bathyarchaeota archaeon]
MKIGCHVSIADSIDKAVDRASLIGCNTFQIFTRSPRMWKARTLSDEEISAFKEKLGKTDISPVVSHMPYLPNLSSSNPEPYKRSIATLRLELERCNLLGIPYLVTHLGSHLGKGKEQGQKQIVNAIDTAISGLDKYPMLLLENTSGKTNEVGSTFIEIGAIIDRVSTDHIGVCFDTCHAYARGYDIATPRGLTETINEIESRVGMDKIKIVHLNDSKGELDSRMDRHNHIGEGNIGEKGFLNFLSSSFKEKPLILETPIDEIRSDKDNVEKARELYMWANKVV